MKITLTADEIIQIVISHLHIQHFPLDSLPEDMSDPDEEEYPQFNVTQGAVTLELEVGEYRIDSIADIHTRHTHPEISEKMDALRA